MSLSPAFKYITPGLAGMIKARPAGALKDFVVVDVRDSDYAGGNIVQALNYPSEQFHDSVRGLVERLKDGRLPSIYAETRALTVPEAERAQAAQEILVLRGGFADFQARYRDDPELVEKFNKYYHD